MNWFLDLLLGDSVAHAILVLSIVIAIGLTLGRWKVGGVSIGSAWILFADIAFGHAGLVVDSHTLHFVREFGLVDRTVHVVTYDAPYGDILINKYTEYVLCR